ALQQDQGDCLTAAHAGQAAGSAGGGGGATTGGGGATVGSGGAVSGCVDRAAPVSRFAKAHSASRKHGLQVSGTATDRGCGANGHGTVKRVAVAVWRRVGKQCAFLQAGGALAKPASCTRAHYLAAKGTARWTLRLAHRLPAGTYVVAVRATDAAGNTERGTAKRNRLRLHVR
ncbi:MAG: hypothetical protein QOG68_1742, partial [Solirubrobacteraceae bacterium]|nr:hypothetical protein [Solirubrobacteraceae bacterium]